MSGHKAIESGQAAQSRTVKHGVSRLLPYAPPWLMWVGILMLALLGWQEYSPATHDSPWYSLYPLAVVLAHGGAMLLSRKMTQHKDLNDALVVLAQSSIMASMLLSVLVGILGPNRVLLSLWGGIGGVMCLYWSIRRMHLTGDAKAVATATTGTVATLLDKLNGAKVGNVIQNPETGVIEIPLEANRGEQDIEDLQEFVNATTSVAGLRRGAGKLVPDDDDVARGVAKFYPTDILTGKQAWPGPSAFGSSIAWPIPVGRRLDYTTVNIHLTADPAIPRVLPQWLIMGMSGAGKSAFFRMLSADILTRKDVTLWVHDHVKGLQTLKPVLEGKGCDWVSMSLANGKSMLASVREVIRARARWMGAHDLEDWVPECGLNLLVVWLEEANELGQLKDLVKLVKEGRSVGVVIFISMQRASHVSLDTETRAQLSGNVCFGVESTQDAMFGLSDYVRARGAEPERWKNNKQGYCYIDAPGITESEAALEARTFFAERDEVVDAIRRGGAVRRSLSDERDQLTIKAAGKAYAERLPQEAYLPGHPLFAKATGLELNKEDDNEYGKLGEPVRVLDGSDIGSSLSSERVSGGNRDSAGEDTGSDVEDVDLDEDDDEQEEETVESLTGEAQFPKPPSFALAKTRTPVEKLSTAECEARVQAYLMEKCRRGDFKVRVPDIEKMTPPIRYKAQWIRNYLNRLCTGDANPQGYRLEREEDAQPGEFSIIPPVLVNA
jgi:hypothetical protein